MDYAVEIERLWAHGSEVAAIAAEAGAVLSAVSLDAAATAMPGSLTAGVATGKHAGFQESAGAFNESLVKYTESVRTAADGYRRQEDSSTDAIRAFFGD